MAWRQEPQPGASMSLSLHHINHTLRDRYQKSAEYVSSPGSSTVLTRRISARRVDFSSLRSLRPLRLNTSPGVI